MISATSLFDETQVRKVDDAVGQARQRTAVRVVPVIAAHSGRFERAEDMVGLWAAALGLALVWWLVAHSVQQPIDSQYVWRLGLLPVLATIAGGFAIGTILAANIGCLRRLFVTRSMLDRSVHSAAQRIYGKWLMQQGEAGGKFLVLYVSLWEARAVVVASPAVQGHLPGPEVDAICRAAVEAIADRPTEGICQAVNRLATILADSFPPDPTATADACQYTMAVVD